MIKVRLNLRKVVAIAICLAGVTVFAGCGKDDDPIENPPLPAEAIELTSPITADRTLKDLGLPIDYFFNGNILEVKNNAILTIEDSVTIQFRKTDGKLVIMDGATIKALGTADKRIQFVGTSTNKGSWYGIFIETNKENQFNYVDFMNGGSFNQEGVVNVSAEGAKLNMTNCKISGSLGYGVYFPHGTQRFTAFNNNVIERCDKSPVALFWLTQAEFFDKTSNLTGNGQNYVLVQVGTEIKNSNFTLNATTVPYYISYAGIQVGNGQTFTINQGVTLYMGQDVNFNVEGTNPSVGARLVVNGGSGAGEQVILTRLPNSTNYWSGLFFMDSHNNEIRNAVIEYGGRPNNDANIYAYYRSSMHLENVAINNSYNLGFKFNNSTGSDAAQVTHSNVTFNNNAGGNVMLPDETTVSTLP